MSSFNYILNITGDCQSLNTGAISISFTGGTPPYTVQWTSPPLGQDILISNEPAFQENLGSGNYAVRVNDSTLPVNQEFYINIPVSDGICASILATRDSFCNNNNGAVTGTSTTDYSTTNYLLYSGVSSFVKSATTSTSNIVFDALSPGYYYMVAQDLGGCTGRTQNFIINDSNNFDFGLYIIPNTSCGGTPIGKIYITGNTGTAPYTYQWSNGAILTDYITGLTAGDYSVAVTDANGCTVTKEGTVTNVLPIGLGIFTATPPGCFTNNGILTMTVTGGTAPFYYSASTGYIEVTYSRNFTLSGLSPGDYTLMATDAGLCNVVASTRLDSPEGFSSVNIVSENSSCASNDGKIIINVAGGTAPYTYMLIGPGGNTDTVSTVLLSQTFSNLQSGTYTVIVSCIPDPLNPSSICSYSENIVIIAENKFTISTSVTGTTCGDNNGIVQVVATTGGTLPYLYAIDGVDDLDGIFTNVSPGQHLVTVRDSSGCVQSANVVVQQSSLLDYTLYSTYNSTTGLGTITAFIGSGEPPFNFTWSSNVSGNPQDITVENLTAGTYSVTIVDAAGCSKTATTQIQGSRNLVSLQTYTMGAEVFSIESPTKQGILQMLNEGFLDFTSANTSCVLIDAVYEVRLTINPGGPNQSAFLPFTSTTLNQVPSDNLYYDTLKNLLLAVPGVGNVTINPLNNQLTIDSIPGNTFLNGKQLISDLVIYYNIICLE